MDATRPIWGIYPKTHPASNGVDFDDGILFPVLQFIGVGYPLTGDIAPIRCDLQKIRSRVEETYGVLQAEETSGKKQHHCGKTAGLLHRFACKAQPGDIVVYACKPRSVVYAGTINRESASFERDGGYFFDTGGKHRHFQHLRAVTWLKEIPYAQCTKQELAQIRTQSIFWSMKNCPPKFIAGL